MAASFCLGYMMGAVEIETYLAANGIYRLPGRSVYLRSVDGKGDGLAVSQEFGRPSRETTCESLHRGKYRQLSHSTLIERDGNLIPP